VKFDAIVIGAGAAGLACARDLTGAGKRVCILEARDRIGGRIDTRHLSGIGVPIELGAEFIHGEPKTTFAIVDAAALNAVELPNDQDGFWSALEKIRKPIAKLKRDLSFDEFLRSRRSITPRLRELAWSFVEGYHAAHADRISALALALSNKEQSGEHRQFRIINGYDNVMQWLRAGIDPTRSELRLNTVATLVRWSQGEVVVNEKYRASALVITIPIGVLKSGTLRFDPALAEKERVVAKLDAGHVVKIVFHFREVWWPKGVSFVRTNDRLMPAWWTLAPLRAPILTGWAGGHAADAMLAEPAAARIDRALDAMASAFSMKRATLDDVLVAAYTHDWQEDPFSRGAYSYALVGGSNAPRALAKPIANTLFFAGEATGSEETGTVAGAIESGRRAAKEVLT
jgi:monoamine oxidase